MEEPNQEDILLINQCFSLIRSSNTEKVKEATDTIDALATNPRSIPILIRFYELQNRPEFMSEESKTLRQFSLISLKSSIKNCWEAVPTELKTTLYRHFLSLLVHESVWLLRQYLIDIIIAISTDFDEVLIEFVKQASQSESEAYLEISLILSSTLPNNHDNFQQFVSLVPFFTELLIRGFNSDQPEVCTAAFDFICHSDLFKEAHFFEQHPEYWEKCIQLIDSYMSIGKDVSRILNLFNYALDEGIYTGQPFSLLHQLMTYFAATPSPDTPVLLQLHSVIQNICIHYSQTFDETVLVPLIQLHISLSAKLYTAEDCLAMSEAAFFEEAISNLCVTPHSIEILWQTCASCAEVDEGRFFFLRAIASTFDNSPLFYLRHLSEINELLHVSINSESNLLRNAAARTADDLILYYVYENDEIAIDLIPIVSNACIHNPSSDLLHLYSRLLETTKKTDDYFEVTYPFLLSLLTSVPLPDVQEAALQCLGSLAVGSVIKINQKFPELVPLLTGIIKSSQPQIFFLKVPAVDLVGKLAEAIGSPLDAFLVTIIPDFATFMQQDDISLVLSTIKALQAIIRYHSETTLQSLGFFIQALSNYAQSDLDNLHKSYHELNPDDEMLPDTICKLAGYSLQTLSEIASIEQLKKNDFIYQLVIQCCYKHKLCSNVIIKSSIAKSFGTLVSTIDPDIQNVTEMIKNFAKDILIPSLLISTPQCESNYDIIMAFRDIVHYNDYTLVLGPSPFVIDSILEFIDPQIALAYRPKERDCDLFDAIVEFFYDFFNSLSGYYHVFPNSVEVSNRFLTFFDSDDPRLHSYAIRYLGYYLWQYHAEQVPDELQCKVIEQAMKMIREGNDYSPFLALFYIGYYKDTVFDPYIDQLYPLFLEKLNLPFVKTQKMLLLKDNCVFALTTIADYIINKDEEWGPGFLKSLPISLDYEDENKMNRMYEFFFRAYCKTGLTSDYLDQFMKIIIITLANPRKTVYAMNIQKFIPQIFEILNERITPETLPLIKSQILNNDETKYNFFVDILENGL